MDEGRMDGAAENVHTEKQLRPLLLAVCGSCWVYNSQYEASEVFSCDLVNLRI